MNHGIKASLLVIAIGSVGSVGCGLFERWACGDEEPCGGFEPVEGTVDDFSHGGRDDEQARIAEPQLCEFDPEPDDDVFMVQLETHGEDDEVVVSEWTGDRLLPELQARGIARPQRGIGVCAHASDPDAYGHRLAFHDWTELEAAVSVVLELAEQDDVALQLVFVVEPLAIVCPGDACGL